jgi:hypothetical protein
VNGTRWIDDLDEIMWSRAHRDRDFGQMGTGGMPTISPWREP